MQKKTPQGRFKQMAIGPDNLPDAPESGYWTFKIKTDICERIVELSRTHPPETIKQLAQTKYGFSPEELNTILKKFTDGGKERLKVTETAKTYEKPTALGQ